MAFAFAFAACSDEPELNGEDADAGTDTDLHDVDGDDDVVESTGAFCESCVTHADCEETGARCFDLFDGERICGAPCDQEADDCGEDAFCASVGEETQCVPTSLTCVERCDDIACAGGEFCDPLSGECVREARICDTGCNFDSECGDPETHRCLGTGAPDGETICTVTCEVEPANSDDIQCPSDFFCVPLQEGAEDGVCYPITRTCTDRCVDADCPAGHNCDPFTGECIEAIAGSCDNTCELDAECGGQGDLCLAVGIGEGPHCWRDCTETQSCPDGYNCQSFLQLTTSLCLPINQQCETCYDSDCFPGGVCNPSTGECMPHPEDCTVEGCDGDDICEPTSRRCVAPDRSCSGDSWAVDCDNVVTRCTTQRAGTNGICATLCESDAECHGDTTCTTTQSGDFCLGAEFGGPTSCGILHDPEEPVGRPCGGGAGSCHSGTFCVEESNVPGFCSQECSTDDECPGSHVCGNGPDGTSICLPPQCLCAGGPSLPTELHQGWQDALDELDISACELYHNADLFDAVGEIRGWNDLLLRHPTLFEWLKTPPAAMGALRKLGSHFDQASGSAEILSEAANALSLQATASEQTLSGDELLDALEALTTAAGGTFDTSAAEDELQDVPDSVQQLAAHLTAAVAQAYQARQDAFADAGLDAATLEELFEKTHRVLLPHDDTQVALDLEDPNIVDALQAFPLAELAQISVDLAATVDAAIDAAEITEADEEADFLAIIDTPAGLVILGDASDTTYDITEEPGLAGPIALLLDIGGNDTYRLPVAANQSVDNGVSILVDLSGDDLYSYPKVGDALDGDSLLASDDAGRKTPQGAINQHNGPVSLSETARQGTGRVGIGMLFDRGAGSDTYETLRLGQGAAILGVGAVFDDGGDDTFVAEAFAQGAALLGVGLLHNSAGNDSYRLWHAGQGFATASGVGVLHDASGNDEYLAVTGIDNADDLLYLPPTDRGNVNYSLAQGASVSASSGDAGLAGGLGILRDFDGVNTFTAGSYSQAFAEHFGVGILLAGDGDDVYEARGFSQGTGQFAGAALLLDTGGDDHFNPTTDTRQLGQGSAQILGWGAFILDGGENEITYMAPGGGVSFDGSMAFALFHGGPNQHLHVGAGFGFTSFDSPADSPLVDAWTAAFFVQTGAEDDTYEHPVADSIGIENDAVWRQDDETVDQAPGVGVDR